MKLKVATTKTELSHADKFDGCHIVDTFDKATAIVKNAGFELCSVWLYDSRARHWNLIFDTSIPATSRLPGAVYWQNTVAYYSKVGAASPHENH